MGLDLVNIARTGIARCGLARLNAGEVRYSAGAVIGARPEYPDNPSGEYYRLPSPYIDQTLYGFGTVNVNAFRGRQLVICATAGRGSIKGDGYPRLFIYASDWSWAFSSAWVYDDPTFAATSVVIPDDGKEYRCTWYHYLNGASGNSSILDYYLGDGTYLYTNSLTASGSGYVTVNPYYGQAGGQAVTSGVALSAAHYKGQADGQAAASGSALYTISYAPAADGQLDTSGAADYTLDYLPDTSGQLDASGDTSGLPCYLASASGQLDTSGTAPGFPEMIGPAGGEATLSGIASPLAAHYRDTTGGAGGTSIDGTAPVIFTIDVKGLPVFVRRFDGDVRLTLSETGGIIRIRGGQPEMDDGLSTAINISLLSEGDWWGNALAAQGEDIGSGFLAALNAPLTNRARLDIIEAARSALAWLTDTGIAQAVDVSATIPSAGQLALTITIRQPERSPSTFRYTVNWAAQRIQLQEIAA